MSLRGQVLKGGAYMAARQSLGLVISLGGVLLLTRLIGPEQYGLYSGALGVVTYGSSLARLGLDVCLLRRAQEPRPEVYAQAFTLLLMSSGLVIGFAFLAWPLAKVWLGGSGFLEPLFWLLLAMPLMNLSLPAVATIERGLNYRAIAGIELAGQFVFYVISVTLAAMGYKVWAPVIGFWVWQGLNIALTYSRARFKARLTWSVPLIKEMVGYGIAYSSSIWVWQLRTLVNPLLVGRFVGPAGVGYVSIAIRLVEALSFVKSATWRLSIAALARVQGDLSRLKRALEEGMSLQVLALGPLLAGFILVGPWVMPRLFGDRWAPTLEVVPFIALSYMTNAVFNMHSSVLYVLGKNGAVTRFHLIHVAAFVSAAVAFVPKVGVLGYGIAEMAALISYAVIDHQMRGVFHPSYSLVLPWLIAFVPPLFMHSLSWPWGLLLWISVPLVFGISPTPRRQVREYAGYLRGPRL